MRRYAVVLLLVGGLIAPAAPGSAKPDPDSPSEQVKTFCLGGKWAENGFDTMGDCTRTMASGEGPVLEWSLKGDLRQSPDQANPSPDQYGNLGVWSYMMAPYPGDPATYQLLPVFEVDPGDLGWWPAMWHNPYVPYNALPFGFPFVAVGYNPDQTMAHTHPATPYGAYPWLAVGWTSPIDGVAMVNLGFDSHQQCAGPDDGTDWQFRSERFGSSVIEGSGYLPNPGVHTTTFSVDVVAGDTLWLMIGPHGTAVCDSVWVDLRVSMVDPAA